MASNRIPRERLETHNHLLLHKMSAFSKCLADYHRIKKESEAFADKQSDAYKKHR